MKIMSYHEWCSYMERRFDYIGPWWSSPTRRMEAYHAYYKTTKACQEARSAAGEQAESTQGENQADTPETKAQGNER